MSEDDHYRSGPPPQRTYDLMERVRWLEDRVRSLENEAALTSRRLVGVEQVTTALAQRPICPPQMAHMGMRNFSPGYMAGGYPYRQDLPPPPQPQQPTVPPNTLISSATKEIIMIGLIGVLLGIIWATKDPVEARGFARKFIGTTIEKVVK